MNNNLHQEVIDTQETEFAGSTQSKQKMIIHFTSGETMEVKDSDEEEEQPSNSPPFREPTERNLFSFKNVAILIGRISLHACDFLGERLASALGLNAPKYQFVLDQYQHDHKVLSSQASGGLTQGQGEMTCFSHMDGSQYGATEDGDLSASIGQPPLEYRGLTQDFVDWCQWNCFQISAGKTEELVVYFCRRRHSPIDTDEHPGIGYRDSGF